MEHKLWSLEFCNSCFHSLPSLKLCSKDRKVGVGVGPGNSWGCWCYKWVILRFKLWPILSKVDLPKVRLLGDCSMLVFRRLSEKDRVLPGFHLDYHLQDHRWEHALDGVDSTGAFGSWSLNNYTTHTWRFPEIGVLPNHPFIDGFSIIKPSMNRYPPFQETHIYIYMGKL